jgi:hypothetical protein
MLVRVLGIAGALTTLAATQLGTAGASGMADPGLSAERARTVFVDAGYQADQLQTWDWLSPPVITFQVHDRARDRVLLIQVYPNVAAGQRGSERMVEGYSARTSIDNLALFEANAAEYEQVQTAALARSVGMQSIPEVSTASARPMRVDTDYARLVLNALTLEQTP